MNSYVCLSPPNTFKLRNKNYISNKIKYSIDTASFDVIDILFDYNNIDNEIIPSNDMMIIEFHMPFNRTMAYIIKKKENFSFWNDLFELSNDDLISRLKIIPLFKKTVGMQAKMIQLLLRPTLISKLVPVSIIKKDKHKKFIHIILEMNKKTEHGTRFEQRFNSFTAIAKDVIIDIGITFEGRQSSELPEKLFIGVRYNHVDPNNELAFINDQLDY